MLYILSKGNVAQIVVHNLVWTSKAYSLLGVGMFCGLCVVGWCDWCEWYRSRWYCDGYIKNIGDIGLSVLVGEDYRYDNVRSLLEDLLWRTMTEQYRHSRVYK